MAVKYQVQGLRIISTAKFKDSATTCFAHGDFAHAIHIVYTSTPGDVLALRTIVADVIHERFDALAEWPDFESSIRCIPGLAYLLLERRNKRPISLECSAHGEYDANFCTPTWCKKCLKHSVQCPSCHPIGICYGNDGWESDVRRCLRPQCKSPLVMKK